MGKLADWWAWEVAESKKILHNIINYPLWVVCNIVAFFMFIIPWQLYFRDVLPLWTAIVFTFLVPVPFAILGYFFPNQFPPEYFEDMLEEWAEEDRQNNLNN